MDLRRSSVGRDYAIGLAVWLIALFLELRFGAAADAGLDIILQLRLPRAILGSAVGMGLAVAGAILQAVFANPLCEPYTLGVSSGASLGAVIAMLVGYPMIFIGISLPAFAGGLACAGLLSWIAALKRERSALGLLLAGVMLGFFCSSLVALVMALADPNGIQSALFWMLGDLSRARLSSSVASLGLVSSLSFTAWRHWRTLDGLLMGEEGALALGIDVPAARTRMILLVSLLIAVCVSGSGMIGFVGLVIPHFCRRRVGSLHLTLIPLCAVWGAATLVLADWLARVAHNPYELPVGVMTSLLGAPVFLWIMLRERGRA
jgi:iron complex transport system permease protein